MPRSMLQRLTTSPSNAATKCTAQDAEADRQEACQIESGQFSLFSKPPPELRHQIWTHAFQNEPRVVSVVYFRASPITLRFRSLTLTPSAFHACREARAVGMSLYYHVLHDGLIPVQTYVPPAKQYLKSSIKVLRGWVQGLFRRKLVSRRPVEDDTAGPIYVNPDLDIVYVVPRDYDDREALMGLRRMDGVTRCVERTARFPTYSYLVSFCPDYTRACNCGNCPI